VKDAYRDAGVDIDAGDALVDRIAPMARATERPGVMGGLGGFGGLFSLAASGRWRDPVLVSGTDGVGTKLLVAQKLGRHHTIGIDLVAMCANDIAVTGAEPLFFLDYFATGRLAVDEAASVVSGIAEGCRQAGCALIGGETAEMPGMYAPGHYDLAGFAVGVVERDEILDPSRAQVGDKLVGVPSSGLHSNGYSLVRKLLVDAPGADLAADPCGLGRPLGEELLIPTRIYAKDLLAVRRRIRSAAHITGGGLPGNVPRALGPSMHARLVRGSWPIPPIFAHIARVGGLSEGELLRTLNCGLGLVIVAAPEHAAGVAAALGGTVVGEVVAGVHDGVELV
jgi:phosphoribosylformylglycinamidine cyclo-ligase